MGFWARDHADLHDWWPDLWGGRPYFVEPAIPLLRCDLCAFTSRTAEGMERHHVDDHINPIPMLLYRGIRCGHSALTISSHTVPADWTPVAVTAASVNGERVSADDLPVRLSRQERRHLEVRLQGSRTSTEVRLHFDIAREDDLDGVETVLRDMVGLGRLDLRAIDELIQRTRRFRTAATYADGIATYLYGVLARERSPDSGLPHHEYRGKYDRAVELLRVIHRPVAQAIVGLVSFHYNQFDQLPMEAHGTRLGAVADRITRCLRGERLPAEPAVSSPSVDMFSDRGTEQVLRWWAQSPSQLVRQLDGIEARAHDADLLDRVKLQVLAGEVWLHTPTPDRALAHAHDLRNSPIASRWSASLLAQRSLGPPS